MKRTLLLLIIFILSVANVFALGKREDENSLVVFAAVSLKEALEKIQPDFESRTGIKLVFSFDSSGTLRKQLINGAKADVFISASTKQMDELERAGNFVKQGTRMDYLKNRIVLVSSEYSKKNIQNMADLKKRITKEDILLAVGNSDVPVGEYTAELFKTYNIDEQELVDLKRISYGSNAREVCSLCKTGAVDAAIVYSTDAYTLGLNIIDNLDKFDNGNVDYPLAVLTVGDNEEEASIFVAYLEEEKVKKEFEGFGFICSI